MPICGMDKNFNPKAKIVVVFPHLFLASPQSPLSHTPLRLFCQNHNWGGGTNRSNFLFNNVTIQCIIDDKLVISHLCTSSSSTTHKRSKLFYSSARSLAAPLCRAQKWEASRSRPGAPARCGESETSSRLSLSVLLLGRLPPARGGG